MKKTAQVPGRPLLPLWGVPASDVMSFFDSLDRDKLKEMLQTRVADGSMLRLIGKCLHVGVLEGEQLSTPEMGAVQGSVLSPVLGNIYLHYVLDVWFEREVTARLRGKATLVRYCDDFVIAFELEEFARRVMSVLPKRMEKYGVRGHYNDFGVSGNFRSLQCLAEAVRKAWFKWLCRRSQ